jgi:hypothetical protein
MQDLPEAASPDHILRPSNLDINSMMAIQELHIEPRNFWDNISLLQFEVQLQMLCRQQSAADAWRGITVRHAFQLHELAREG